MKKIFEHAPFYFLYSVGATYLGLLVMVLLNIPVSFLSQNESLRNLIRSVLMEIAICAALFVLFRIAGEKQTKKNEIDAGAQALPVILAQAANLLLHTVFMKTLPGSLTGVYFTAFLYGESGIGTHKTTVFLVMLAYAAPNILFCLLGYVSGAKKRIKGRAALTGSQSPQN